MDDIAASVYPEQSPETRAKRARDLIHAFKRRPLDSMNEEEVQEAIGDLVSDLMHLADTVETGMWKQVLAAAELHYEAERYDCDCAEDLVPGAFYPVEHDGDSSRAWVERCDNYKLFPDDWEAAMAVAMKLGVGWTHSGGTPWLVDPITRNALPWGYGSKEVVA